MKKLIFALPLLLFSASLAAEDYWEYDDIQTNREQTLQLRVGADFTKHFEHNLNLSLSEEIRLDMVPFDTHTLFDRSFTTVTLDYSPIKYFKIDGGYMLKLIGSQSTSSDKWTSHWADPNEYIKHRVFLSATAQYKYLRWKFAFRERLLLDMRTDSINPLERNKYDLTFRHRVYVDYNFRSKPLKTYTWLELANTLNAPTYQQKYTDNTPYRYDSETGKYYKRQGRQYLERVRFCLGAKWKLDRKTTLNFFYRLDWGYSRDVNISKDGGDIELRQNYNTQHALGIAYQFDW